MFGVLSIHTQYFNEYCLIHCGLLFLPFELKDNLVAADTNKRRNLTLVVQRLVNVLINIVAQYASPGGVLLFTQSDVF